MRAARVRREVVEEMADLGQALLDRRALALEVRRDVAQLLLGRLSGFAPTQEAAAVTPLELDFASHLAGVGLGFRIVLVVDRQLADDHSATARIGITVAGPAVKLVA